MDSVLIVSNKADTMKIISSYMASTVLSRVVSATSGGEARRYLSESEFDLVIIDSPLQDEEGIELAMHAAQSTSSSIILIVEKEHFAAACQDTEQAGVFVLEKSVNATFFCQAARLLDATRRRWLFLEAQNKLLQQEIEEIKVIDRAKITLVQVLQMTEAQAHRYIVKQSMDLRQSRLKTAESILRTYES